MRINYAGTSHVGMKRGHNEDNFFLLPEYNLFVVADGMGGHSSGEVASQIAIESLANFIMDSAKNDEITWPYKEDRSKTMEENRLINGIKLANRRIFETNRNDGRFRGMGTTIVSFMPTREGAMFGHVGDSRGYMIRDNQIKQITEDHSLLNDYLKVHQLTPEEIAAFPHKNVIVRALGMKETVDVDITKVQPRPYDRFLICSDGLSGMVPDDLILKTALAAGEDLELCCRELINRANENGGQDNISVIVVQYLP